MTDPRGEEEQEEERRRRQEDEAEEARQDYREKEPGEPEDSKGAGSKTDTQRKPEDQRGRPDPKETSNI